MRGLLSKDFRLLLGQKRFFITVFVIGVLLSVGNDDAMFAVGYCSILATFFTLSTISYDEFNHGFSFLFTLPVTRRSYVLEKYLFGLLAGGAVWLATAILGGFYGSMRQNDFELLEWFSGVGAIFVTMFIFLCLVLPVHLKFGAEKGKIVVGIVGGVLFGIIMLGAKSEAFVGLVQGKLRLLEALTPAGMAGFTFLAAFAVAAGSVLFSINIMKKKQF